MIWRIFGISNVFRSESKKPNKRKWNEIIQNIKNINDLKNIFKKLRAITKGFYNRKILKPIEYIYILSFLLYKLNVSLHTRHSLQNILVGTEHNKNLLQNFIFGNI